MFWIPWLQSDSLFAIDDSGMVKWNEQNYTRVSVPTKTNSKIKLFHKKLPFGVTKETAGSQKKKTGEVPTLKPKETGDCVKCKRFCGSGDHPSSDRFVSLDTRSKFIAMGRRLEF